MFITFEGPEGSGKSTQISRVVSRLKGLGKDVAPCRAPGHTIIGQGLRELLLHAKEGEQLLPWTEVFMFLANHVQLGEEFVKPAVQRGVIVVCDRFLDSTLAYQGYGRELGADLIQQAASVIMKPDLTVLFDVSYEVGHSRITTAFDRLEREVISFHRRVREGYLEMARQEPDRYRVINGDNSVEQVEADVWDIFENSVI